MAEIDECPHRCSGPGRLIVTRQPVPEEFLAQLYLFQMGRYSYRVLVTNLEPCPSTWRFYSQRDRADVIIRQLKHAYALGKIPIKDFQSNEASLQIVMLAYNLLNGFKRLCAPAHLQGATLQTFRQGSLLVLAQLVRPDGVPTLRLAPSDPFAADFLEILKRTRGLRLCL